MDHTNYLQKNWNSISKTVLFHHPIRVNKSFPPTFCPNLRYLFHYDLKSQNYQDNNLILTLCFFYFFLAYLKKNAYLCSRFENMCVWRQTPLKMTGNTFDISNALC